MPMVLPQFDLQSRYDYETYYHLTLEAGRFRKALARIEAFKMTQTIPGVIIETKEQRNHWIDTEAGGSISTEQLSDISKKIGVENLYS